MRLPLNIHKSQLLLFFGSLIGIFILTFSITSGRAMLLEGRATDTTVDVTMVIQNKMDVMNVDGNEILFSPDIAWYGNGKTSNESVLGLRFTGTSVPSEATIVSAKIGLTSAKNQWISVATSWSAENQVSPQFYGVGDNLLSRTLLSAQQNYRDNKRWIAEKTYYYDVTDIVKAQQALSVSAGSSGENGSAAISFIIKGTGRPWARKYFYANPAFGKSPFLSIKYSLGTSATPAPTLQPTATPLPTVAATPSPTPAPTTSPMPTMSPTSQLGTDSMAMGRWTPAAQDSCTKEEHDSYFKIGPDGKKYPTWHPPVHNRANGTTCTFGHEHGRDPSGSNLVALLDQEYGGILFGYGNEKLDEYNTVNGITNGMRHEDHVGHKIEWENTVKRSTNNCAGSVASPGCFDTTYTNVTCDFLMKAHQGTHSVDAFANNIHELVYAVNCSDGTKMASTKMVIFGKPGEFVDNDGKSRVVTVGSATPANSPSNANSVRFIPTNVGVSNQILVPQGQWSLYSNGLYEDWVSSNYLSRPGSSDWIAYFDPHFAVFGPSRYHDPSAPSGLRRSIEVCYLTENNGTEKYRGGECDQLTNYGQNMTPVAYDDPRSPFNGVKREFYFNNTGINNKNGPTAWYTDPYGRSAQTTTAPGFIKHFVAAVDNRNGVTYESDAIGGNRWYGGQGVHAPN